MQTELQKHIGFVQLSIFDRALVSLILSQKIPAGISESNHTKVKNILNDLFRITARTAYVASRAGEKGPTDSKSQAATMLSVLASGAPYCIIPSICSMHEC